MDSTVTSVVLLLALIGFVALGRAVRKRLPDHHLNAESTGAIKLAMGVVATMTALVLGLLLSSAMEAYDTERTEVVQMAAKIAFIDRVLSAYGPEGADARRQFLEAATDATGRLWPPDGTPATRALPAPSGGDAAFFAIERLAPRDDVGRALKDQAASTAIELAQMRMLLVAQLAPSLPRVLLLAVIAWLVIIFLSFSLMAPPNATTAFALGAAAISVTLAVFLIMELDQPLGGVIRISNAPILEALKNMAQ